MSVNYQNQLVEKLAQQILDTDVNRSDEVKELLTDIDSTMSEQLDMIDELQDALRRIRELTSVV